MPCFKMQLPCIFVFFGETTKMTVLFLHRKTKKGFCCKTVNITAGVCLEMIYLPYVGIKILHSDAK